MTLTKPDREILAMAPGQQAGPTLTIVSGAITLIENTHAVDTEGAAPSDDLDTINAGSAPDGGLVLIHAAHDARTVVVKHGTGNITTLHGDDITLDASNHTVLLRRAGAGWNVISPRATRRPAGTTELIEEKTASGDATLDFVTGIDSSYDEYILTGFLQPATDDVQLAFTVSNDGGSSFEGGTQYSFSAHYIRAVGAELIESDGGASGANILIGDDTTTLKVGNGTDEGIWFRMRIINAANPALNTLVKGEAVYTQADGQMLQGTFGGQYHTNEALDGFRLAFVSDNISAGTVRLLGVNR